MTLEVASLATRIDLDGACVLDCPLAGRPSTQGSIVAVEIEGRWLTQEEIVEGLERGRDGHFRRFASSCSHQ